MPWPFTFCGHWQARRQEAFASGDWITKPMWILNKLLLLTPTHNRCCPSWGYVRQQLQQAMLTGLVYAVPQHTKTNILKMCCLGYSNLKDGFQQRWKKKRTKQNFKISGDRFINEYLLLFRIRYIMRFYFGGLGSDFFSLPEVAPRRSPRLRMRPGSSSTNIYKMALKRCAQEFHRNTSRIKWNKLLRKQYQKNAQMSDMVAHTCNSTYSGDWVRKTTSLKPGWAIYGALNSL